MNKKKIKRYFLSRYRSLRKSKDSPHSLAGGISIGVFLGISPLFGIKTVGALLLAWIFRCSKVSALVAVSVYDLLLPLWPLILRWEYMVGHWILSSPHRFPGSIDIHELEMANLMQWETVSLLWPILVGSIVFATPMACGFYYVTWRAVHRYQRHRQSSLINRIPGQVQATIPGQPKAK